MKFSLKCRLFWARKDFEVVELTGICERLLIIGWSVQIELSSVKSIFQIGGRSSTNVDDAESLPISDEFWYIFQNFSILYETRSDASNVWVGRRLNASQSKKTFWRVSRIIACKPFVCFTGDAFTLSVLHVNKTRFQAKNIYMDGQWRLCDIITGRWKLDFSSYYWFRTVENALVLRRCKSTKSASTKSMRSEKHVCDIFSHNRTIIDSYAWTWWLNIWWLLQRELFATIIW